MRGTPHRRTVRAHQGGIIPAYAGNTRCFCRLRLMHWDHPRVCGEHCSPPTRAHPSRGSSPRMRGTHADIFDVGFQHGIIPAYAGNTMAYRRLRRAPWDHPRVCGEHINCSNFGRLFSGSSPRMRGTPDIRLLKPGDVGIIPAYAGNTLRDYSNFVVSKFMSFVFHLV